MATRISLMFVLALVTSSVLLVLQPRSAEGTLLKLCGLDKIYQLGDSISDTGNLVRETPVGAATVFARLPYGETFFGKPTGRCSNGLLMIDYLALSAGLPFLQPYKNQGGDFRHGANFAVAGSTALPAEFLASKNVSTVVTNSFLGVQLDWMSTHLNSTCHTATDCAEKLRNSLFMVGEIGGNDYNYALFQGKTIEEAKALVPDVVDAIAATVRRVIELGAARVIVPGNFPIGCFPIYLTGFKTDNSAAYDDKRCLKEFNDFSAYHNAHLQQAIEGLKTEYPNVAIAYGDYYNAFQWLFLHAPYLGFDGMSTQKACCGYGGEYNFNLTNSCGASGVPVCPNPDRRISWDGVHPTQQAYKIMAGWLIRDVLHQLHCPA
ncbi:Chlorogenate--glucarate O-hydroxycinnamoyltransferase [Bertholletia excelsa]